jgi:molybdopterin-guanine dinucleotide biosynthesis protein A
VVAVDMPDASEAVLRLLANRAASAGCDAAVPRTERGLEPLHAVYAKSAAPLLRAAFEAGERSVTKALGALDLLVVEPDEWGPEDQSARFARNVNRPEDLPG